jgi:hypothetical protein
MFDAGAYSSLFARGTPEVQSNVDVLVTGHGGTGQGRLMRQIRDRSTVQINNADDADGLKHLSSPQKIPPSCRAKHCIYVFGDPLKSICEHFRRGEPRRQMQKLEADPRVCNAFSKPELNCAKGLSSYLVSVRSTDVDIFGIQNQMHRWATEAKMPVYMLDVAEIAKESEAVSSFLGADVRLFDVGPPKALPDFVTEQFPDVKKLYDNIYCQMKKVAEQHNLSNVYTLPSHFQW